MARDVGESFILKLPGYFTEQQQGRWIDLKLSYGYTGTLALLDSERTLGRAHKPPLCNNAPRPR
eukprot:2905800-Prymnesium_polylepis.1